MKFLRVVRAMSPYPRGRRRSVPSLQLVVEAAAAGGGAALALQHAARRAQPRVLGGRLPPHQARAERRLYLLQRWLA